MADILNLNGQKLETEPKVIDNKEIVLKIQILDNGMMIPEVQADNMLTPELHYWLCKFAQLVLK